jgi:hypothetical protein
MMSDRVWMKTLACSLGLHDWQAVLSDPDEPAAIRGDPYALEMECSRYGKRKIVTLSGGQRESLGRPPTR